MVEFCNGQLIASTRADALVPHPSQLLARSDINERSMTRWKRVGLHQFMAVAWMFIQFEPYLQSRS